MIDEIVKKTEEKMLKSMDTFHYNLAQIRTGRANPNMLERISVMYYGTLTPINQIAAITVPEGRQLLIKPYDKSSLTDIERALNEANLGMTPQNDGENIRLNIPALTEDSRKAFVKDVYKYGEEAKVTVRNLRREANETIKKDKELTEDDIKGYQEDIQVLTDNMTKKIDEIAKEKEKEIMNI